MTPARIALRTHDKAPYGRVPAPTLDTCLRLAALTSARLARALGLRAPDKPPGGRGNLVELHMVHSRQAWQVHLPVSSTHVHAGFAVLRIISCNFTLHHFMHAVLSNRKAWNKRVFHVYDFKDCNFVMLMQRRHKQGCASELAQIK